MYHSSSLERKEQQITMIAKVLIARNLTKVRMKVQANKGSAGIDGMSVKDLTDFIRRHRSRICTQIISRSYKA